MPVSKSPILTQSLLFSSVKRISHPKASKNSSAALRTIKRPKLQTKRRVRIRRRKRKSCPKKKKLKRKAKGARRVRAKKIKESKGTSLNPMATPRMNFSSLSL